MEEDGKVTVYKGDKKTLFEPTEILVSIPSGRGAGGDPAEQVIDTEEELYNFLENYSC